MCQSYSGGPAVVCAIYGSKMLLPHAVAFSVCSRKPFNKAVLACYVQLQDVRGIPLVESIRRFAKSVILMHSPHWVRCVMDEFARHYHTSNPRSFDSAG